MSLRTTEREVIHSVTPDTSLIFTLTNQCFNCHGQTLGCRHCEVGKFYQDPDRREAEPIPRFFGSMDPITFLSSLLWLKEIEKEAENITDIRAAGLAGDWKYVRRDTRYAFLATDFTEKKVIISNGFWSRRETEIILAEIAAWMPATQTCRLVFSCDLNHFLASPLGDTTITDASLFDFLRSHQAELEHLGVEVLLRDPTFLKLYRHFKMVASRVRQVQSTIVNREIELAINYHLTPDSDFDPAHKEQFVELLTQLLGAKVGFGVPYVPSGKDATATFKKHEDRRLNSARALQIALEHPRMLPEDSIDSHLLLIEKKDDNYEPWVAIYQGFPEAVQDKYHPELFEVMIAIQNQVSKLKASLEEDKFLGLGLYQPKTFRQCSYYPHQLRDVRFKIDAGLDFKLQEPFLNQNLVSFSELLAMMGLSNQSLEIEDFTNWLHNQPSRFSQFLPAEFDQLVEVLRVLGQTVVYD